jgi:hypothetical protein
MVGFVVTTNPHDRSYVPIPMTAVVMNVSPFTSSLTVNCQCMVTVSTEIGERHSIEHSGLRGLPFGMSWHHWVQNAARLSAPTIHRQIQAPCHIPLID